MIIRKCDIWHHNTWCLSASRDLWLIDDEIDDDEGFTKHNYYVARRIGKDQDFEVLSDFDFEVLQRIGSSYTKWTEAVNEADDFIQKM